MPAGTVGAAAALAESATAVTVPNASAIASPPAWQRLFALVSESAPLDPDK
jgi:hypothetical protein